MTQDFFVLFAIARKVLPGNAHDRGERLSLRALGADSAHELDGRLVRTVLPGASCIFEGILARLQLVVEPREEIIAVQRRHRAWRNALGLEPARDDGVGAAPRCSPLLCEGREQKIPETVVIGGVF